MNKLMAGRIRRTGTFRGQNSLVLVTVGRKSGEERKSPVAWFPGPDGSWLIVASAGGAPKNPAWYYNLAANPDKVRIELSQRTVNVKAEQLNDAERAEAWPKIATASPTFADYQEKTDREIPVIRLIERPAT